MLLRRYLMMAQQSSNKFELIYDAAIGKIPPTTEWSSYHFVGGSIKYDNTYGALNLSTGSSGDNIGLMPTERVIGQADNISISTVARIGYYWYPALVISVTNGNKGAIVKINYNGGTSATTTWNINAWIGTSQVRVKKLAFDFIDSYAKIKLVLTGDTYTLYINDEEIYIGQAVNYTEMPTNYQHNMIANNCNTWGQIFVTNMTYKEW